MIEETVSKFIHVTELSNLFKHSNVTSMLKQRKLKWIDLYIKQIETKKLSLARDHRRINLYLCVVIFITY